MDGYNNLTTSYINNVDLNVLSSLVLMVGYNKIKISNTFEFARLCPLAFEYRHSNFRHGEKNPPVKGRG